MGTRRRIMGTDFDDEAGEEASAWKSAYDDNGDGGSEYNSLRSRSSVFDDVTRDTQNPVTDRGPELALERPVDGPGVTPDVRETLVAVFPKGRPPLVARALRNADTGEVRQIEAYRNASIEELEILRARGALGEDAVAPPSGSVLPWKKILFAGALAAGGIYAWRRWMK